MSSMHQFEATFCRCGTLLPGTSRLLSPVGIGPPTKNGVSYISQDALSDCLALAEKLQTIHINYPMEATVEAHPFLHPNQALAIVNRCSPTLTQFGCNARVWQVRDQRSFPLAPIVPKLSRLRSKGGSSSSKMVLYRLCELWPLMEILKSLSNSWL